MEKLEAGILGTVFRNEENGWTVLTVRSGRNEVTVVGTLPELSPGEQAVFTGEWTEHRSYGRLFGIHNACDASDKRQDAAENGHDHGRLAHIDFAEKFHCFTPLSFH